MENDHIFPTGLFTLDMDLFVSSSVALLPTTATPVKQTVWLGWKILTTFATHWAVALEMEVMVSGMK